MAHSIKVLPDHVANQIAAGEVVQRPASVVKELMENAIDAGAARIQLIVKDGGKTLVQVVDDGTGMGPQDAELSFRRHATSKIEKAEDLFNLHTKGFRGEALASIAAIAQVEMLTRTGEASLATRIRIAGDQVTLREEAVGPVGTSVSVRNLFFNIPARRNFLKSAKVEFRHVLEEFNRVALAHPGISFSLFHNDSELHQLPVAGLRQRISHLMGRRMTGRLVPVEEDTQLASIQGFIVKPEFAKKSRGEQYFFVNDRFIKSSYLHHAVMGAFEGLLKPDTFPGYFLYLQMPPESLDINIHPTKTEIKFEDEQSLYAILRSAIKHSLGQFSIRPVLDFDSNQNLETPYEYKDREAVAPKVSVDRHFNPFTSERSGSAGRVEGNPVRKASASWTALYEDPDAETAEAGTEKVAESHWVIESDPEQESLFDAESTTPSARAGGMFQLGRKYILTRIKSGLLVIDQQRAHQRVVYERLLRNVTLKDPASQVLLFPLELELSPSEVHMLRSMEDTLCGMGFLFGNWGEERLQITALPEQVAEGDAREIIESLIEEWDTHEAPEHFSQADRIAKALCRSLALKPGTFLEAASQQALLDDLFACKEPGLSPFNKKIHTTLTVAEFEKRLK